MSANSKSHIFLVYFCSLLCANSPVVSDPPTLASLISYWIRLPHCSCLTFSKLELFILPAWSQSHALGLFFLSLYTYSHLK